MSKMIDSLDYLADNVDVAPRNDWRILRITVARVAKKLPRYCKPNCDAYRKDSDNRCLIANECNSFIFDTHHVDSGQKLFDVLFATNSLNPHEGFAWMVGEKYLKTLLGDKRVKKMVKEYEEFLADSSEQETSIIVEGGE